VLTCGGDEGRRQELGRRRRSVVSRLGLRRCLAQEVFQRRKKGRQASSLALWNSPWCRPAPGAPRRRIESRDRQRTHGRQGVVEVGLGHTRGLDAQLNRARTPRNVRRARQEQWQQRHGGFSLWPKAGLRWARTGRRLGRWVRVGPTGSAQYGRIVFFRIYF
jgi:hypothetical protein